MLKKLVEALMSMHRKGNVRYETAASAKGHGYQNPAAVFVDRLLNAPWSETAAAINDGLVVTMKIDARNTVVGRYKMGVVTVFHCGPITGGVGYETNLGNM